MLCFRRIFGPRRTITAMAGGNPRSGDFSIAPASDDASFRRYFGFGARSTAVAHRNGRAARQGELRAVRACRTSPCRSRRCTCQNPWRRISNRASAALGSGHQDLLGRARRAQRRRLYEDALDALLRIQRASRAGLPITAGMLEKELRLFPDWYVARSCATSSTRHNSDAGESVFDDPR